MKHTLCTLLLLATLAHAENPTGNTTLANRIAPSGTSTQVEWDAPFFFHNSGDAATTRTGLGLQIGANVEAWNARLDVIVANSGTLDLSGVTLTLPAASYPSLSTLLASANTWTSTQTYTSTLTLNGAMTLGTGAEITFGASSHLLANAGSDGELSSMDLTLPTMLVVATSDGGGNSISLSGSNETFQSTAGATINLQVNNSQTAGSYLLYLPNLTAGDTLLSVATLPAALGAKALRTSDSAPVVSSTTFANDDTLFVALTPGTWRIKCVLMTNSVSAAPGILFLYTFSGTYTYVGGWFIAANHGDVVPLESSVGNGFLDLFSGGRGQGGGRKAQFNYVGEDIINVTVAGTLNLQWCQDVSSTDGAILTAGSYIEATPIP